MQSELDGAGRHGLCGRDRQRPSGDDGRRPEGGGRNLAPRPMEMVLLGTGGCTAYDVVMILKKSRQEIAGCSVTLKAERASEDPKIFTKIHFHFTVTGKNLNPNTVERAINLSHDKYCSASIMLAKTAELSHSFEIVEN